MPGNKYFSSFRQLWVIKSPPYVGQRKGKSVMAKVWRDGEVAKAKMFTDERDGEIVTKEIRGSGEVVLTLEGYFII